MSRGSAIEISDPLLPVIQTGGAAAVKRVNERVQALLGIKAIFGDSLPQEARFVDAVTAAYLSLQIHGAKATVAEWAKAQ